MKSIHDVIVRAESGGQKVLSVCAAHDEDVIKAVAAARKSGFIKAILVGDEKKITSILCMQNEDKKNYEIIDTPIEQCASAAVSLVRTGRADFLMKGLIGTADMMRAVVDRESGLRTDSLISHVMLYESPGHFKLLALTDGGVNTFPDKEKKIRILKNAAAMLQRLGYEEITAACICGAEVVDPKIQSTVDAGELAFMNNEWAQYNMRVIGPVGLDIAICKEACQHKNYHAKGGGDADILLVPSYEVGNGIGKALTYFAGATSAGVILGAQVPIVLVSRSDEAYTKLASIALASLLC